MRPPAARGTIDVGLIPSIEYLRGGPFRIVPDLSIASRGPVASVAVYTTKPMQDVRSIALDTSSRTSVALVRVLCKRVFKIAPRLEHRGPDLGEMLEACDAALIIGDNALTRDGDDQVEKIDLGETWMQTTGLPFVYAFWAGRHGCLSSRDVEALQGARDLGLQHTDEIAREYFAASPERQAMGTRYLQDNIKYSLGAQERAGLELFYQYAVEAGVISRAEPLRFF
jgi:chorismate dehydratase